MKNFDAVPDVNFCPACLAVLIQEVDGVTVKHVPAGVYRSPQPLTVPSDERWEGCKGAEA